jgi:hypothetical protein
MTVVTQQRNWTKSILASIGAGAVLAAAAMTYGAVDTDVSTRLSEAPSSEFGETTTKSATPSTPLTSFAAPTVLAPPAPTSEPG